MSLLPVSSGALALRPLDVTDVSEVLRIQALCYGEAYAESADVFTRRLQSPGHCSWAALWDGQVVAYLAAYWSAPGMITPLQGEFEAADPARLLYLHDMAVEPTYGGRGIARHLLEAAQAQAQARGIAQAALVAVQGAHVYWARQGFVLSRPADDRQCGHLRSYGEDAVYMERHGAR